MNYQRFAPSGCKDIGIRRYEFFNGHQINRSLVLKSVKLYYACIYIVFVPFCKHKFEVSQLKHLTPKTSLRISKMWPTIFLSSKFTEIFGNLSRFQFVKTQKKTCSYVWYLRQFLRYREGRPYSGKLIRLSIPFWCTLCNLSIIGNQRQYSSLLSILVFIGTPCISYSPYRHKDLYWFA